MFEGMILRELNKEDLNRPLRAKELVGVLLFILSFGLVGLPLVLIHVQWLRILVLVVVMALLPLYIKAMVRLFRASGERWKRNRAC